MGMAARLDAWPHIQPPPHDVAPTFQLFQHLRLPRGHHHPRLLLQLALQVLQHFLNTHTHTHRGRQPPACPPPTAQSPPGPISPSCPRSHSPAWRGAGSCPAAHAGGGCSPCAAPPPAAPTARTMPLRTSSAPPGPAGWGGGRWAGSIPCIQPWDGGGCCYGAPQSPPRCPKGSDPQQQPRRSAAFVSLLFAPSLTFHCFVPTRSTANPGPKCSPPPSPDPSTSPSPYRDPATPTCPSHLMGGTWRWHTWPWGGHRQGWGWGSLCPPTHCSGGGGEHEGPVLPSSEPRVCTGVRAMGVHTQPLPPPSPPPSPPMAPQCGVGDVGCPGQRLGSIPMRCLCLFPPNAPPQPQLDGVLQHPMEPSCAPPIRAMPFPSPIPHTPTHTPSTADPRALPTARQRPPWCNTPLSPRSTAGWQRTPWEGDNPQGVPGMGLQGSGVR